MLRFLVGLLLLPLLGFSAITRVQEKNNATGATTNPNSVVFTSGTLANSFVIACAVGNVGNGATAAIANDKGDTAIAWPVTESTQLSRLFNWCWYFKNPTAGSKTYTITLSNAGTISFLDTFIAEYSGVDNTTQPDVTITVGTSTGTTTTCSTPTLSPATVGDLLIAMAQMATTTGVSGGSGTWTLVDTADGNGYADNLNGTTTASQKLTFTSSSSGQNICQIAAFKASTGGGGGGGSPTMPPVVY